MARFLGLPLSVLLSTLISYTSAQILIPEPNASYVVGHNTIKLTDTSRKDPYDPLHRPRNVMTSLFYPILRQDCPKICPIPYMPPATAALEDAAFSQFGIPNGTFESIALQVCCNTSSHSAQEATKAPLVLFSPGLGSLRHEYGALAQKVASAGYAVVTMDHVYEAPIVEYPDGSTVLGLNSSYWDPAIPGRLEALLDVRVADARFVLTQLGKRDVVKQLIPGATCGFDTKSGKGAAMYGHSFGGATAIAALMKDSRFAGAINMDGSQYGNLTDTKKPAVLFGRADPSPHNRTNDETWVAAWTHLKGWKREVALKGVEHITFSDMPLLVKLAMDAGLQIPKEVQEIVGTLDMTRSFELITRVVKEFFGFVFKGKQSDLLNGKAQGVPELVVDW